MGVGGVVGGPRGRGGTDGASWVIVMEPSRLQAIYRKE